MIPFDSTLGIVAGLGFCRDSKYLMRIRFCRHGGTNCGFCGVVYHEYILVFAGGVVVAL